MTPVGLVYLHRGWRQGRPEGLDFIVPCRYAAWVARNQCGWKSRLITVIVECDEYGIATRVLEPIDEAIWTEAEPKRRLISLW